MHQGDTKKAHNKQTVIDLHQHDTREEHTKNKNTKP